MSSVHERPSERGREWSPDALASDHSRPRSAHSTARGTARTRAARKAPDERRAEIAEAARALALDDGLAAVTLRGVAARGGLTPALVAHYRPNMDELVAETFRTIVAAELREVGAWDGAMPPEGTGPPDGAVPPEGTGPRVGAVTPDGTMTSVIERLGTLVHTLLDGSRDDVTLIWVEAWALGRRNERLAEAVREQMDAWQSVLQHLIEDGAARGEFEVDDPAAVAWQLLGMIDGLNAQALVRWGEGRSVLLTHALEGLLGLPRGTLRHAAGNAL
jgi:AcrR family transcriptional regulator